MLITALLLLSSSSSSSSSSFSDCSYKWFGNAPNCTGAASNCTSSKFFDFVRLDKKGDGEQCTSGEKVLCASCGPSNDFLASWMGSLLPVLGNMSLLDVSLPGTHDSMTFDLSQVIADNANDIPPELAWIAHEFGPEIGELGIGEFIREQAQTQGLSMKEQLEAGARFIDFRISYSAAPDQRSSLFKDWYSLHLVQNNNKAFLYLEQAKAFLDEHPEEVIVLWLSRHGSECRTGQDQYPGTSPALKQRFWNRIKTLFGDMLFDREKLGSLNATSLGAMVGAGQRVVIYASDYEEFTGNDTKAYDSCSNLYNSLHGGDLDNLPDTVSAWQKLIEDIPAAHRTATSNDQLYLVSWASGGPDFQLDDAFALKYDKLPLGLGRRAISEKCAQAFHIPNMTEWCPPTLLDLSQLRAFYLQGVMEEVTARADPKSAAFPGAIYLDALDKGGRIRTGTTLLSQQVGDLNETETALAKNGDGIGGSNGGSNRGSVGYAYVDTVLLHNLQKACAGDSTPAPAECAGLLALVQKRRAMHPLAKWDDSSRGRHARWPSS